MADRTPRGIRHSPPRVAPRRRCASAPAGRSACLQDIVGDVSERQSACERKRRVKEEEEDVVSCQGGGGVLRLHELVQAVSREGAGVGCEEDVSGVGMIETGGWQREREREREVVRICHVIKADLSTPSVVCQ